MKEGGFQQWVWPLAICLVLLVSPVLGCAKVPSPTPTTSPAPTPSLELEFEWSEDPGIRIMDGSVPYIYRLTDGRFRLYYSSAGGILSAISSDGLNFQKEPNVRIESDMEWMCADPTIVELEDGRIRMYYKGAKGLGGPGEAIHKVFSAISSDGINFQKEGLRIDSEKTGDRGWASVPEAIKLPDGRVRIYYVSGDFEAGGGIMSAISDDGLNFRKESGARIKGLVDPAITTLPDGRYIFLVVSLDPRLSPNLPRGIYSFISEDGLNFENQQTVLQRENVYDPSIIEIDDSTYRIYYGEAVPPQPPMIKSIIGHIKS